MGCGSTKPGATRGRTPGCLGRPVRRPGPTAPGGATAVFACVVPLVYHGRRMRRRTLCRREPVTAAVGGRHGRPGQVKGGSARRATAAPIGDPRTRTRRGPRDVTFVPAFRVCDSRVTVNGAGALFEIALPGARYDSRHILLYFSTSLIIAGGAGAGPIQAYLNEGAGFAHRGHGPHDGGAAEGDPPSV